MPQVRPLFEDDIVRRKQVSSSVINEIEYDPKALQLTVYFNSGSIYTYYGILPIIAEALWESELTSVGQYFNRHIREQYGFFRVR